MRWCKTSTEVTSWANVPGQVLRTQVPTVPRATTQKRPCLAFHVLVLKFLWFYPWFVGFFLSEFWWDNGACARSLWAVLPSLIQHLSLHLSEHCSEDIITAFVGHKEVALYSELKLWLCFYHDMNNMEKAMLEMAFFFYFHHNYLSPKMWWAYYTNLRGFNFTRVEEYADILLHVDIPTFKNCICSKMKQVSATIIFNLFLFTILVGDLHSLWSPSGHLMSL